MRLKHFSKLIVFGLKKVNMSIISFNSDDFSQIIVFLDSTPRETSKNIANSTHICVGEMGELKAIGVRLNDCQPYIIK